VLVVVLWTQRLAQDVGYLAADACLSGFYTSIKNQAPSAVIVLGQKPSRPAEC